jgi:hypothetical protein
MGQKVHFESLSFFLHVILVLIPLFTSSVLLFFSLDFTSNPLISQSSSNAKDEKAQKVRIVFGNGDVYEGDFFNGEMHGMGLMAYSSGRVYGGEFKKNVPSGNGRIVYEDGKKEKEYTGSVASDKKHGMGRLVYSSGCIFDGQFEYDHIKQGRLTFLNGKTLSVSFLSGCQCIDGKDIYEGELASKGDVPHGQGKMLFEDGIFYDGEWKNGVIHGMGKVWFIDGSSYEGAFTAGFDDHSRKEGKQIDLHGKVIIWKDGKIVSSPCCCVVC